ncbi:MAG TPA: superoxide dismutase family protein [Acidimicrobiia bacterium]|nr:superoxide dismutase family protein [Acidimicrobiia bacterium]
MKASSASVRRSAAFPAAALVVALLAALALPAGAEGTSVTVAGPLTAYDVAGNPAAGVTARVHEVVTGGRTTTVTLHLHGFAADQAGRTFGAHAHSGPCGTVGTSAGPHYTHPDAAPTLEEREIWLDFTVDAGGTAHAKATRDWTFEATETAPFGARSVVVHAMPTDPGGVAGARLACIEVPFV